MSSAVAKNIADLQYGGLYLPLFTLVYLFDKLGDIDECQECGLEFNQAYGGYYIDDVDLGPNPDGDTGRLFKEESAKFGNDWSGFEQEDIGPVCDSCSWILQRRREIMG